MADIVTILASLGLILFGLLLMKETLWEQLCPLLGYRRRSPGETHFGEKIYFQGQYSAGTSILSPLTKTPCLRWRLIVAESRGKGVVTIIDQTSREKFFVTDSQQILPVFPRQQNSQIDIGLRQMTLPSPQQALDQYVGFGKCHYQVDQHLFQPLQNPQAIAFLKIHQINLLGPFGNPRGLQLREYIWRAGDSVYIFGKVVRRDRQEKLLIPQAILHRPRFYVFLILATLGFLGLMLCIFGVSLLLS
jgi:hypothetical protein